MLSLRILILARCSLLAEVQTQLALALGLADAAMLGGRITYIDADGDPVRMVSDANLSDAQTYWQQDDPSRPIPLCIDMPPPLRYAISPAHKHPWRRRRRRCVAAAAAARNDRSHLPTSPPPPPEPAPDSAELGRGWEETAEDEIAPADVVRQVRNDRG